MPATHLTRKYCAPKTPPINPLKGLILERIAAFNYTNADLAEILHCSEVTAISRKKGPMREWRLGELFDLCMALEIPIEELRAALRYQ